VWPRKRELNGAWGVIPVGLSSTPRIARSSKIFQNLIGSKPSRVIENRGGHDQLIRARFRDEIPEAFVDRRFGADQGAGQPV
jgi:hypothetical protein